MRVINKSKAKTCQSAIRLQFKASTKRRHTNRENGLQNPEASCNARASSYEGDVSRLYIKRRNGGMGLIQLMSAYSCSMANLSDYIEQGNDRFCRLIKKNMRLGRKNILS